MATYTPHTAEDVQAMLSAMGLGSIEELYRDIPSDLLLDELRLPQGKNAADVDRIVSDMAAKNTMYRTILRGAGAYYHYIPSVVPAITGRAEFLTAYTPYQAELSQGVLQAIFEYQSMICALTGMDVSNASHYDGATAAAEACLMCAERGRTRIMTAGLSPEVMATVCTYLEPKGMSVVAAPIVDGRVDTAALADVLDGTYAGFLVSNPNYFGLIEDMPAIATAVHAVGARLVVYAYPIALGLLKKPSEYGADIVVGEGQPLGMPLSFGGPYLGYMAATKALSRKLPGRIVGETVDRDGKRAYVLTLQAREQHIRREKASSNICSNEALCALTATVYLAAQGEQGLRMVARSCVDSAHALRDALCELGFHVIFGGEFFNEFVTDCPVDCDRLMLALSSRGILGGLPVPEGILWCATEMFTAADLDDVVEAIREVL